MSNIDINKKRKAQRVKNQHIFCFLGYFFVRVLLSDTVKESAVLRSKF